MLQNVSLRLRASTHQRAHRLKPESGDTTPCVVTPVISGYIGYLRDGSEDDRQVGAHGQRRVFQRHPILLHHNSELVSEEIR